MDAGEDESFVVPDGGVECDAAPCVLAISGGGGSFCALLQGGKVACWGESSQGQLGVDPGIELPAVSTRPRAIDGLDDVTHVSIRNGNACARVSDGGVFCWGDAELVNAGRTLTPDEELNPPWGPVLPTRMDKLPPAATIEVGLQVGCITSATGAMTCWGRNESFVLGRGPTPEWFAPPAPVTQGALAGKTVALARPGASQTFAVLASGEVASWGQSGEASEMGYFLGRDTSENPNPVPTLVPNLKQVRALSTTFAHSCAIAGRFVECWGFNDEGQLGRGYFAGLSALPSRTNLAFVAEADDAGKDGAANVPLAIATGISHTCAVLGGGRVYCWGSNNSGQLGADDTLERTGQPRRLEGLSGPAVALASTNTAVCVLLRHGEVQCWGSNYAGELGIGKVDNNPHPQPTTVTFPH